MERLYPLFPVEVSQSQTNIGSEKFFGLKKNYGAEEILGPQKFLVFKLLVQWNFGFQKFLGPNISCIQKNVGSKTNFLSEKMIEKNMWSEKNFGSEKILG